ncbi:hypothetical protein A9Q84_17590 [Halobacteriovorax marinus]|uniref:Lipoprotein n=1 Tax=Halobacteriovorax marinus TaxID=97084 RepID=A0A1Y5F3P1_9BACT|nr:hypothetical protein A9Q84_17590 [Halobacteriovorax marinus]
MKAKILFLLLITSFSTQVFAELSLAQTFEYIQNKVSQTYYEEDSAEFTMSQSNDDKCVVKFTKNIESQIRSTVTFSVSDIKPFSNDPINSAIVFICKDAPNKCMTTKDFSFNSHDKAFATGLFGFGSNELAKKTTKAFNHLIKLCIESDPF